MLARSILFVPALVSALAAGCSMHSRSSFLVDGVRLEEHHEEVLTLESWHASGLLVDVGQGDLSVRQSDGPTRLRIEVWEKTPGDATARYENGRIVLTTASGEPAALSDVYVETALPIPRLALNTGMGDIRVEGVQVDGSVEATSGMGDVEIVDGSVAASVSAHSGMGDVELSRVTCGDLSGASGMGDVELLSVEAAHTKLSTGMGDVDVSQCKLGRLDAHSGMGDVECANSTFERGEIDSGMGRVRLH